MNKIWRLDSARCYIPSGFWFVDIVINWFFCLFVSQVSWWNLSSEWSRGLLCRATQCWKSSTSRAVPCSTCTNRSLRSHTETSRWVWGLSAAMLDVRINECCISGREYCRTNDWCVTGIKFGKINECVYYDFCQLGKVPAVIFGLILVLEFLF